jgi:DNA mismatch endonuclease (patch repair protein)
MDVHSKEIRSYNMSKVKNKATKPEEYVRKFLFKLGFRYRKNVKNLPGCPDIVLPRYKTIIFVNGCFWHVHENCSKFSWPANNHAFWESKLIGNKKRDSKNIQKLVSLGWKVITVWECELRPKVREERLEHLVAEIRKETTNNN